MSSRFELRLSLPFALLLNLLFLFSESPLCAEEDAQETPSPLGSVLLDPDNVETVLFLTLAKKLDGAELTIDIPPLASRFVSREDAEVDPAKTIPLELIHRAGPRTITAAGIWRPRSRSENCQLSFQIPNHLISAPPGSVLLLARRTRNGKAKPRLECHLFANAGEEAKQVSAVLKHFGLTPADHRPGLFGLDSEWSTRRPGAKSDGLQKFLAKFDEVSAKRFTPTLRSGSTGIGYTLETLLDIKENNNPQGDFLGIELKSHRGDDFSTSSSKKMNLFLKEPRWLDGLSHKERIPKYGYVDDNGRTALYSTATSRENSHGLKLIPAEREVFLAHKGEKVATWDHEILAGRLQEKLKETIFVGAETRGSGRSEEFHFQTALYCREPSARRLASLIATGEAMVEMRMHIKESGSARNHGTAFRIRQNSLPQLYRMIVLCRGVSKQTSAGER